MRVGRHPGVRRGAQLVVQSHGHALTGVSAQDQGTGPQATPARYVCRGVSSQRDRPVLHRSQVLAQDEHRALDVRAPPVVGDVHGGGGDVVGPVGAGLRAGGHRRCGGRRGHDRDDELTRHERGRAEAADGSAAADQIDRTHQIDAAGRTPQALRGRQDGEQWERHPQDGGSF